MNNQSILLLAAILGLGIFGVVPQDAVAMADDWLGINSSHLHSYCGGWGLGGALDGVDFWNVSLVHLYCLPHGFILDLGESTAIEKVRGRSVTSLDPLSVDIYVSDDLGNWGMAVATGITTWQGTSSWVEIDTIDKIGRYIKVEVNAVEGDGGDHYMEWGLNEYDEPEPDYITIFDAYAGAVIPARRHWRRFCHLASQTQDTVRVLATRKFDTGCEHPACSPFSLLQPTESHKVALIGTLRS
ncbi:MAG: hypothetical protein ACYS19_00370 [Planctomycetota bacterium]